MRVSIADTFENSLCARCFQGFLRHLLAKLASVLHWELGRALGDSMIKKVFAAAAAVFVMSSAANASVLDFAAFADANGERGYNDGALLRIGGERVGLISLPESFTNSNGVQIVEGNPYLDAGDAGLGLCRTLDAALQCVPSSDDSVQGVTIDGELFAESIGVVFSIQQDVTELVFRDGDHRLISEDNDGLVDFYSNGGLFAGTFLFSELMALAVAGDAIFRDTNFIGFAWVDTAFYLSSATISAVAEVPLPGALPLIISGLAGLGFASRRRKEDAALL